MKKYLLLGIIALSLLFILQTRQSVSAQSGGNYDLTWNTVNAGGSLFSTGGSYALGGSVGQSDAGVLGGGIYTLNGGFWSGALPPYQIFLSVIRR